AALNVPRLFASSSLRMRFCAASLNLSFRMDLAAAGLKPARSGAITSSRISASLMAVLTGATYLSDLLRSTEKIGPVSSDVCFTLFSLQPNIHARGFPIVGLVENVHFAVAIE